MGYQGIFENFISTGVIVVSINYRLNVFGRLLCLREADVFLSLVQYIQCKFLCVDCDGKFKRTFPTINIKDSLLSGVFGVQDWEGLKLFSDLRRGSQIFKRYFVSGPRREFKF